MHMYIKQWHRRLLVIYLKTQGLLQRSDQSFCYNIFVVVYLEYYQLSFMMSLMGMKRYVDLSIWSLSCSILNLAHFQYFSRANEGWFNLSRILTYFHFFKISLGSML